MSDSLLTDPMLADVPVVHGYRVLDPAVLVRKVAEGGMAAVYLGVHLRLRVPVAVKVLKPFQGDATARAAERFGMEAEQAARLGHPNIVRVFDFRSGGPGAGGPPYLVMEYIDGETVESRTRRKQRLGFREAATIALLTARGLKAAHREQIVHRDIKPANVLVSRGGDVKLTDLGIAKAATLNTLATGMTQENTLLGTPQYMAPELWRGARHASFASDLYALGATLAFMLMGDHGLGGGDLAEIMHRAVLEGFPDLRQRVRGLDPALGDIVRRATAQDPAKRPTAAELEALLQSYLAQVGGEQPLDDLAAGGLAPDGLPSQAILTAIRKTVDSAERPRQYNPATLPAETLDSLTRSAPLPTPRAGLPLPPPPPPPQIQPPSREPARQPAVPPRRPPVSTPAAGPRKPIEAVIPPNPLRPAGRRKRRRGRTLLLLAFLGLLGGAGYAAYRNGWVEPVQAWWATVIARPATTAPATRPTTLVAALPATAPGDDGTTRQTPAANPTTGRTPAATNPRPATQSVQPPRTQPATTPVTRPAGTSTVIAQYQAHRGAVLAGVRTGNWSAALEALTPMLEAGVGRPAVAPKPPETAAEALATANDTLWQFREAHADPTNRRRAVPTLQASLASLRPWKLPAVDLLEFERHVTETLGGQLRLTPTDGTIADARAALERCIAEAPAGAVRSAALQRGRQLFQADALLLARDNKPDLLLALLEGGSRRPEWQGEADALAAAADEAIIAARPADGAVGTPFTTAGTVEKLQPLASAGVTAAQLIVADQWIRRRPSDNVFPVIEASDAQRMKQATQWFERAAQHADARMRVRGIARLAEISTQSNEPADHAAAFNLFRSAVQTGDERQVHDPIALTGLAAYYALAADDMTRRVLSDRAFDELRRMDRVDRAVAAVRLARRAADAGDVQGRYNLGTLLAALVRQNLFAASDMPAIDAEIRLAFKAALDGGHPVAADKLAAWERR
jgi:serine/threonine protein kinase/TPR repeat protein